jgi:hypothetical protein
MHARRASLDKKVADWPQVMGVGKTMTIVNLWLFGSMDESEMRKAVVCDTINPP